MTLPRFMLSVVRSATLAGLAALTLCQGCGASKRPVAVVNGETITQAQLDQALMERAGQAILRQMIDESVIHHAATKASVTVTDKDIDGKIEEIRARYPSPQDFDQMVASSGQSMERIRKSFELQLLIEKLAAKDAKVTDEQCKQHYDQYQEHYLQKEQVHLRDMEFESKENATNVLKALKVGGDFAALAKEFSTDPATKDKGGDMGEMPVDALQPHLKAAADKLEPGKISDVFEGMGAWYLLKLEKRTKAQQRPFDECKEEIRTMLTQQETQMAQGGLVEKLREAAVIEIKDPKLDTPKPAQPGAKAGKGKQ